MPSTKNINQLKNLKDKIAKAKSLALTDYKGLNANQQNLLRSKIKEVGGEVLIAKNTLLKLAFNNKDLNQTNHLTGPTMLLLSYDDEVAPLKALVDFAKEADLPKLKAGFLGANFLETDQIISLAKLPNKPQLQAQLTSQLAAPFYGLVNVLSANLKNFVYVLNAIAKEKNKN